MAQETQTSGTNESAEAQGAAGTSTDEAKHDVKLTKENQSLRTRLRAIEAQHNAVAEPLKKLGLNSLEDLSTFAESFESRSAGTGKSSESDAELATLRRTVEQLKVKWETSEKEKQSLAEKSKAKTRDSVLSKLLAEGGVMHPAIALELLSGRAKVEADDAVLVRTPDGEEEVSMEVIRKILPESFFPAKGVTGTGSKAPGTAHSKNLDLANMSQSEYLKNRDAIIAQKRGLSS